MIESREPEQYLVVYVDHDQKQAFFDKEHYREALMFAITRCKYDEFVLFFKVERQASTKKELEHMLAQTFKVKY